MTDIKMAGNEDVQLLCDLSNITFIETYRGTCPDEDILSFLDKCFNENVIAEEVDDKSDFYFIAFLDKVPAGYMLLKEEVADYAFLKNKNAIQLKRIYVLKEYHSKKIGAALMNYALEFSLERGYNAIWLGVWEHNEKAKSFYKKWGFEETGTDYDFYTGKTKHNDKWMIKVIER
jgi:ribosomal protein S18 acetylase RimI-like enzyme